jgi:hypothetical protein
VSDSRNREKPDNPPPPNEVELEPAGEAVVINQEEASPAPTNKRIHARRPLPQVPDKPAS